MDTMRGATTAFRNITKTTAVTLSNWMNNQIKNIFDNKELVAQIVNYVKLVGIVKENYEEDMSRMIKGIIVKSLTD